jgi:hypothetical protein
MRLEGTGTADGDSPEVRVRSILAGAATATISRVADVGTSLDVWLRESEGRLLLGPLAGPLPSWLSPARQPLHAVVEVTDVAPVPAVDRVRARVQLGGTLIPAVGTPEPLWHCLAETLHIEEGGSTRRVGVGALLRARPDPLAGVEGMLLAHLDAAHPDAVEVLTRLLPPHLLHGVVRVRLWRLDRRGLVLRLHYLNACREARLWFAEPANSADAVTAAMRALLERARRTRPGCRRSG